jgi:hypothetical protein
MMCEAIEIAIGLPAFDVLMDGPDKLIQLLLSFIKKNNIEN